jgi:hypothetical protein
MRFTRHAAVVAMLTIAAGGVFPAQANAAPVPGTDTLAVDFSTSTGEFRGGASGTLYGFGDDGAPTQALIDGANITNTSQKPPFGTQHPSGDALKVEDGFFAKGGEDMYVYVQDYYPDWAYNGGNRPGDTRTYNQADGTYVDGANGIWDYLEVTEFVTEAVATQSAYPEKYVFIPFNEPDGGNWYNNWGALKSTFLADWDATYAVIQAVYDRHGLGHARVGGPGDASWQPARSSDYLDSAKQSGTLPDVFIWHELGISNLETFRSHLAEYRQMEADKGIAEIPVNITEYGLLRDMGVPGQLVQWFSMFEDEKVDAQTAYWNYAGNFSDNSARAGGANAGWWMFKWYGDLQGSQTVKVTPPQLNVADTLQGIGAVDAADKRATVLFGGTDRAIDLDLSGIDPAVFGTKVDVEVRENTLSGAEGIAGTPRVIQALNGVDLAEGGSLSLSVDTYDRYAAYQVVITPQKSVASIVDAVWSASVEAEDTALTAATAYTQSPTANGGWKFLASHGRDVGSFNSASSKADWTIEVPRDGRYRLQVIGSTPGTPGRHALFVDGAENQIVQYTADLALNDTSRWQYRGSTEVTLDLTAGSHVLSLRASEDGSTRLPNSDITLDKFVLTDVTDGEPTTYPASTLRLFGGAALDYADQYARGSAVVKGDGQRADAYLTAWESGYYDVTVDYRTAGASAVGATVNGRSPVVLDAPGAGAWTSTFRAHLPEGISSIELRSDAGASIAGITTTRVESADAAAVTVQGEDAIMHGAASASQLAANTGSNATGMAFAGNVGNGAANFIEVARQPAFASAGEYDVVVRYSNAEVSGRHDYNPQVVDRPLVIGEGGVAEPVGSAYFRYTYSWNSFWERTVPVTLATSDGSLTFGSAAGYAPNIDSVTIAPAVLGSPTTVAGDNPVPTVKVTTAPAPGESGWFTTAPVVVTGEAGDDTPGAIVEYSIDGAEWASSTEGVSVGEDGRHAVRVRAVDSAGARSEESTVDVDIDSQAPTSSARANADGTVTLASVDSLSGVAYAEYSVDGGATWTRYEQPIPPAGSGATLLFRSVDRAGNVEESRSAPGATTPPPASGGTAGGAISVAPPAGATTGGLAMTGFGGLPYGVGAGLLLVAGLLLMRRTRVRRGGSRA